MNRKNVCVPQTRDTAPLKPPPGWHSDTIHLYSTTVLCALSRWTSRACKYSTTAKMPPARLGSQPKVNHTIWRRPLGLSFEKSYTSTIDLNLRCTRGKIVPVQSEIMAKGRNNARLKYQPQKQGPIESISRRSTRHKPSHQVHKAPRKSVAGKADLPMPPPLRSVLALASPVSDHGKIRSTTRFHPTIARLERGLCALKQGIRQQTSMRTPRFFIQRGPAQAVQDGKWILYSSSRNISEEQKEERLGAPDFRL